MLGRGGADFVAAGRVTFAAGAVGIGNVLAEGTLTFEPAGGFNLATTAYDT